jgi:hypothetical protein
VLSLIDDIPPSWIDPPNPNFRDAIPTIRIPYSYFFEKEIGKQSLRAFVKKKMLTMKKKYNLY